MVDTEPPHFLADMNRQEIDRFIDDALVIALVVLDSDRSTARRIAESELAEHLELADASGILYEEYTRVRRPFYRDAFNVFNQLMASLKEEEHQEVLFGVDDFRDYLPASYEDRRYVAWHCRYSTRWDQSRLTTDEEFVLGHSALREHFPDSEILIVSDVEGCDHYARMTETHGLDGIAFSKSVSPSFLGDCALIMGSEFFFSYRGGGIMTVAEVSTMAWEIVAPVMNETMWNRHRLGCWQGPLQRYTNVPRWRGAGELAGMLARGEVLTEPLGAHVQ
jgi:hypothetical protein